MKLKKIHLQYFALLKEERGLSQETFETSAATAADLYDELQQKYHFKLGKDLLRIAVNDEFVKWGTKLKDSDSIIFIPPVAGG